MAVGGKLMPKTVTLRLKDDIYELARRLAASENRSLSNFIETALLRFIETSQYVDEFEMEEIEKNRELQESLRRALQDARKRRGRFVE